MKTALRHCRFLDSSYLPGLYDAFIHAFSDYVVPFALTETQFENHIILNAVDIDKTVGCVEGDRVLGFSLNGFGPWEGKRTVYDAGTGVIPGYRRQGISRSMFEMMLPVFAETGHEQFLLEVVTSNTGAISLYKSLGFEQIRELAVLQCDRQVRLKPAVTGIEVRELDAAYIRRLTSFWDGEPSWQNSVEAINRSQSMKRILGAFTGDRCVGYIVFSSKFGRVSQFAVDRAHRRQGIGTLLLEHMWVETAEGYSPQVINLDKSLTDAVSFFQNRGFIENLSQYEMVKTL